MFKEVIHLAAIN